MAASEQLSSHVDESASVLAVQMVAEKGAPIFPSGTLYLQGATISYLLAPMALLGYGDLEHLETMRLLSVIAGTAAVAALFLFARHATGSPVAGLLAALFLALDPVSVRWSGLVRMYALLQLVTILMLLCFLILLRRPATRRVWLGFIALFWLGVFTHIAICVFLVPMGLIALWKHRANLLDRRRDLTAALAAAGAAPFALLALNRLVTPPEAAVSDSVPGVSFVGDYLLSFSQIFNPNFASWHLLFRYSSFGEALPTIIIALTCLLVGRYVLGMPIAGAEIRERRNMLGVLLGLYWTPILLVAAFATEVNERYLLHLHPLGLALIVLGVHDLASHYATAPRIAFAPTDRRRLPFPGLAGGAAGPLAAPGEDARPRVELDWLTATRVYAAVVAGILVIGTGLRIYNLNRLSLWLDEGFSLLYASQDWSKAAGLDGYYSPHPTGYFLLTKVALLALPETLAGRSISLVCGVLTLPVFFLLARKILNRTGALVATGVLALSPIHLYYTQEARMYALVVLLVALSYLLLITFVETRATRWAVLYGLTLALGVYADYSTAYALIPQAVIILIALARWGRRAVPLAVAGAVAVVAYLPWLPQVLSSINAANEVERRDTYLGIDLGRVLTLVMHLTGFGSDAGNAYFTSTRETAWDRWPIVAAAGARDRDHRRPRGPGDAGALADGARHRRLIATILVAIWISLISPGFAERTILSAVLGWALLIGAMFNGRTTKLVRAAASGSVSVVILVSLLTIQTYQTSAVKQRWTDASADMAVLEPLGLPS
jgi:4-amino-4-deoxy-L-arabinose transferase-like glycosyltransferase